VLPPAGYGTTIMTVLNGNSCASAEKADAAYTITTDSKAVIKRSMLIPGIIHVNWIVASLFRHAGSGHNRFPFVYVGSDHVH